MADGVIDRVHAMLTGEDDGRVCRDIPEEACDAQPRNFFVHVASLAATKTGDAIADPKLTLSWLLTALGAPVALVGLLVPVREAGALLPQLITAGAIRSLPQRKWAWALGSVVQGAAVIMMGVVALSMKGAAAGWAIIALLGVFALARSVCSVSYKDVLGKTVSKSTRGTATGTAASIAAGAGLLFGVLLSVGVLPLEIGAIAASLFVAGGLWLAGAMMFASLAEKPGATDGGGNALSVAIGNLRLLRTDGQLRRFILTRGLLVSTALAPPYLLSISVRADGSGGLGSLGPFVIASALAGMLSTYVWGRLSDRSSRKVLILAGLIAAGVLGAAGIIALVGAGSATGAWAYPAMLFVLMIAYQGVRLGRSTHLVDMGDEDTRLAYTAISNTAIGIVLLLAGGFALLERAAGAGVVLLVFAGMSLLAALAGGGLAEAQRSGDDDSASA